jgi:hypothetical protein
MSNEFQISKSKESQDELSSRLPTRHFEARLFFLALGFELTFGL